MRPHTKLEIHLKPFFFCSSAFVYLVCGPGQLFFFHCGPETPKDWTPLEKALGPETLSFSNKSLKQMSLFQGNLKIQVYVHIDLEMPGSLGFSPSTSLVLFTCFWSFSSLPSPPPFCSLSLVHPKASCTLCKSVILNL